MSSGGNKKSTICPVCEIAHPTMGYPCKGKRNIYQKKYRHELGISKSFSPNRGKGNSGKVERVKPIVIRYNEYPPNWFELRKEIYKRDNWTCQECGTKCGSNDQLKIRGKIQCHHIDYETKNNDPLNLITLCAKCHSKTNHNRDNWIMYFKERVAI